MIRALFDVQRRSAGRILLVPQVFVWSRSAERRGGNLPTPSSARASGRATCNRPRSFSPTGATPRCARARPWTSPNFSSARARAPPTTCWCAGSPTCSCGASSASAGPSWAPPASRADRLREEVIRSPKLQRVIADMAGEGTAERQVMTARAIAIMRGMEAALDMTAIAALDQVVAQMAARMFSAVEVDLAGIERLRELAKEGTLVLLPSHKSHMDYVVFAWILYRNKLPMPVIAAGDNLNFLPLGPVLRRAGAFFIRRSFSGNRLYAAVVDAYVRRLIEDGSSLEFFIEGGRSRTGKLLPPKLGLLSLVVDAALNVPTRTTWFCPVSIGYERFVEEKAFVRELSGGEKKTEDVRGLVKSLDLVVGRYGRLSVQFGKPLSLDDVLKDLDANARSEELTRLSPPRRRAVITRLGVPRDARDQRRRRGDARVARRRGAPDPRSPRPAARRADRVVRAARAHAPRLRRPLQPHPRRPRGRRRHPRDRAGRGGRPLRPRGPRRGAPRGSGTTIYVVPPRRASRSTSRRTRSSTFSCPAPSSPRRSARPPARR